MTRASDTAKLLGAGATILDGTTISTADNTDSLILTSTDADASSGPNLNMFRNSSSPADNDFLGNVKFNGRNDNSQDVQYSEIEVYATDVSDGTEDGLYNVNVMTGGSNKTYLQMSGGNGVVFNEDSADIDFRVESNGNANMLFVNGGNDTVSIGGSATTTAQPTLAIVDTTNGAIMSMRGQSPKIHFDVTSSGVPKILTDGAGIEFKDGTLDAEGNVDLKIDSAGRLLINTTSTLGADQGVLHLKGATNNTVCTVQTPSNGEKGFDFYNSSGSRVGFISINASSTTFSTSSDYRLKENVTYDFNATTRLKQLKPARFNFIADADTTVDGFIAHEVSSIVPEAVNGEKNAMTAEVLYVDGDEIPDGKKVGDVKKASRIDPQGIDQSKIVPLLVKTIQELEARITALES